MANKLELIWLDKDKPISVEPRLLLKSPELSNTEKDPDTGNMLIHGDNLLALKALERDFAGKVKCVYIDPPYNTGSAFEHYDDNREHSQWLNLMRPRLELLRQLLSGDGSIWISIDDDEQAYLKVLCDEVFGRNNFVANVIWEKKYSPSSNSKTISATHDYVLVYAKAIEKFVPNGLPRTAEMNQRYKNPDNDIRGVWKPADISGYSDSNTKNVYPIICPSGRTVMPPRGRDWLFSREKMDKYITDNRIWFGKNGDNVPSLKRFLSEVQQYAVCRTIWKRDEVGDNQEAKNEIKAIFPTDIFATPKPERLLQRIIHIASKPGDLVLDSFLGSGTTAAVAHKMGRRWIGIEMGDHAYTHCKVRMDKVISGIDGVDSTKKVSWQGGGGYIFYEIAPTLINKDAVGIEIINKKYNADMLAIAVALHEGFTYRPDTSLFWKQSVGSENSYIFVTTRHVTDVLLAAIAETMAEGEFLIVACRSFDSGAASNFPHIAVKKIPQMLLSRCEFGKSDYSLNITNPPACDDAEDNYDDE